MGVVIEIFVKYPGVELELRPLICNGHSLTDTSACSGVTVM
jgi:hypothetical protein